MNTTIEKRFGRVRVWFAIAVLATVMGCNSDVTNDYSGSSTLDSERSPSGLTVFREMVKTRKRSTETLMTLSPTLERKIQTLVWSPNYFPQHDKVTLDRIESWLRSGGKTLVYVGRDFSPNAEYWDRVSNQASSPLSAKARGIGQIKCSTEAIELDRLRDEHRQLLVTPWFYWRQVPGTFQKVQSFQGEWSQIASLSNPDIHIRSPLKPFEKGDVDGLVKELDWNPASNPNANNKKISTSVPPPPNKWVYRNVPGGVFWGNNNGEKVWNTDDVELLSTAKAVQENDFDKATILLATKDGIPLITEVKYRSSTSRVLVLSNISLIANLGLLNRSNRDIADKIISKFENGPVGFLTGDIDPKMRKGLAQEEHKGFEMLTVWPFNVMTIHAALVAVVAAIAAFPIFGRPKTLPMKSSADFADHVESLGELLRSTGGQEYAKDAITKYFRIVRRDTKSAWATRITAEQKQERDKFQDESSPYNSQ